MSEHRERECLWDQTNSFDKLQAKKMCGKKLAKCFKSQGKIVIGCCYRSGVNS
jgi:hypothetical protein